MLSWQKQDTSLGLHVHAHATQGGPTLFAAEVEALLQIAKAGGSSWRFYEGEGANLAWALAASRHWSRRLADLEDGLVQVGEPATSTGLRTIPCFHSLNRRSTGLMRLGRRRGAGGRHMWA